jgi:hypothetical protein
MQSASVLKCEDIPALFTDLLPSEELKIIEQAFKVNKEDLIAILQKASPSTSHETRRYFYKTSGWGYPDISFDICFLTNGICYFYDESILGSDWNANIEKGLGVYEEDSKGFKVQYLSMNEERLKNNDLQARQLVFEKGWFFDQLDVDPFQMGKLTLKRKK